MINVDISNIWSCLSLPELLSSEKQIFDAHLRLQPHEADGADLHGWLDKPDSITGRQIHSIRRIANRIRSQSQLLIVCGSGSVWRGAKAAVRLLRRPDSMQVIFAGDSLNDRQWRELSGLMEHHDVSLHLISDDGKALGVNVTSRGLRWLMERKYGAEAKDRISIATIVGSPLHRMGQEEGYELFPLPRETGGTSSVLTAGGLIPLAAAEIDPLEVWEGAQEAFREMDIRSFDNPAWLYAAARYLLARKGRGREILCFTDRSLQSFGSWWQHRCWGHEGGAVQTDAALLPDSLRCLDRMAQSNAPIFETLLRFDPSPRKIPVEMDWKDYDGLSCLSGRNWDDVEAAVADAFVETHSEAGVPLLDLQAGPLTPQTIGSLFLFFELADSLTAAMDGRDPFREYLPLTTPSAIRRLKK